MSRSLSTDWKGKKPHRIRSHSFEQNKAEAEALFVESEKWQESKSFKESNECLLKAAALGHTGALVNLGNNFASGIGVDQSDEKAAYWYKRAYRKGDDSGAFNLALDKLRGNNIRSAIVWFDRACSMGSGEAAVELAKIYMDRKRGQSRAIHYLEMTQSMKASQISDEAKQEAKLLFSKTNSKRTR